MPLLAVPIRGPRCLFIGLAIGSEQAPPAPPPWTLTHLRPLGASTFLAVAELQKMLDTRDWRGLEGRTFEKHNSDTWGL